MRFTGGDAAVDFFFAEVAAGSVVVNRAVLFFGFLALGFEFFFRAEAGVGSAVGDEAVGVFLVDVQAL